MPRLYTYLTPDMRGNQLQLWSNQANVGKDELVLVTYWDNPNLPGSPPLEQRSFRLTLGGIKDLHAALGKHLEAHGCTSSED